MSEAKPTRGVALDDILSSIEMPQVGFSRLPDNPMQALMEAAPGYEPVESLEELQPLREAVADCIDALGEQDRYVIDAVNSERATLQELGDRLGVSRMHASRLRDQAFTRLRVLMTEHPVIRHRLGLDDE
jgi:DNA-directed RNA polymerase sigma subunit (sigma70/sigma32)